MTGTFLAAAVVWALVGALAGPASAAELRQVGVGTNHSCALKTTGEIRCWGRDESGVLEAPRGRFARMSIGDSHACALKKTDRAVCWGSDDGQALGELSARGRWKSITAGYYETCGIRPNGEVECFGAEEEINATPGGRFRSVSLGTFYACGLRATGKVACWGAASDGETMPPSGEFTRLSAGAYSVCAQRRSGRLSCWGSDEYGLVSQLDGKIAGQVRISEENYCGLPKGGGGAICGGAANEVADPPGARLSNIALNLFSRHACGLLRDRKIACWGENDFGQTDVPPAFLPTQR